MTGPPFARGALILASVLSVPDNWRLCVVLRNRVQESGSYELRCAGGTYNVAPQWLRVDPDAPR